MKLWKKVLASVTAGVLCVGGAVACRQRLETRLLLLPAQGLAERAGFAHVEKKTEELLEKLQKHRITSEQCMPGGLYGMREATSWQ